MKDGPDYGCGDASSSGPLNGLNGLEVTVHCGYFNHNPRGNDLGRWDHLDIKAIGGLVGPAVTGRLQDKYVHLYSPAHRTC